MIITNLKKLRKRSKEFKGSKKELEKLVNKLETELENSEISGVGLSAIQIGLASKVAIVRTSDLKINLYNAKITKRRKPFIFKNEGCLSIPNIFKDTLRFLYIELENGDGTIFELTGYNAVVAQHEIDHQNGILFIDRAIE